MRDFGIDTGAEKYGIHVLPYLIVVIVKNFSAESEIFAIGIQVCPY